MLFVSGRALASAVIFGTVVLSTGCQQSTVISALEAAVSAAEIAIPVIGAATHLNPQTSAAIVLYLEQVNIATAQASTILAGTGTTAQKSVEIVQAFAKVAAGCNCVPAGTPQEVVTVIQAVAQAVANFLVQFPPAKTTPPVVKVTPTATAALANLRTRSEKNVANLKGVKK
jgi:hypothetical protein